MIRMGGMIEVEPACETCAKYGVETRATMKIMATIEVTDNDIILRECNPYPSCTECAMQVMYYAGAGG